MSKWDIGKYRLDSSGFSVSKQESGVYNEDCGSDLAQVFLFQLKTVNIVILNKRNRENR